MTRGEAVCVANIFMRDFIGHRKAFLKIKDIGKEFIYKAEINYNNHMKLERVEAIGEKENGKILKPMVINTKSTKVLNAYYKLVIKDMEKLKKDYLDIDDIEM